VETGIYTDPFFFEIFSLPFVQGDGKGLSEITSIVISEKLANKLFEGEDPIGQTVMVNSREAMQVTGVFQNIPYHSSFRIDFALPISRYEASNQWLNDWGNNGLETYIKVLEDTDSKVLNEKLTGFIKSKKPDAVASLFLQPVADMHLYGRYRDGKLTGGRIEYVRLFVAVAFFIVLIACFNFMNLATAQSSKRAREVGVRKTIGANKSALIGQFLGESFLMTLMAVVLAFFMVELVLPSFNVLVNKQVSLDYTSPVTWLVIVLVVLVVGTTSGLYPAFFLASFKPVKVLKGHLTPSSGAARFRKSLVVLQFVLSVSLISCSAVVYNQVNFIMTKNLGLQKDNLIIVEGTADLLEKREAFIQTLASQPGIQHVSMSSQNPLFVGNSTSDLYWEGQAEDELVMFQVIQTNGNFLETMGMELVQGRDFRKEVIMDTANLIVNEEAVRAMGIEDPVGKKIDFWSRKGEIIGVVKDFHSSSLHNPIDPLVLTYRPESTWMFFIRAEAYKTEAALNSLQKVYRQFEPAYPLDYVFLDKAHENMYRSEVLVGRLSGYFSFLAIFISCLGLLGLSAFSAEQRKREIGIRKVHGASVWQVVFLLSKDFTVLVMIAFLIAVPIVYLSMNQWLSGFAFRVPLSAWVFLLGGASALAVALATVSIESVKAAMNNPVSSLKAE
jgi:ABC-type antimicrobial peptide transport system permease subunit